MAKKGESPANDLIRIGVRSSIAGDLYHLLLRTSWWKLIAMIAALYVVANALFAFGYMMLADGIDHVRPGSFADAYFFSVQTLATIGYGHMVPRSLAANILVTIEAFLGLFGIALSTGLMFAKFSKPKARVLFSHVAVVSDHQGTPSLMFRMGNERRNQILEAQIRLVLARYETTPEGERFRRLHDLKLVRDRSPFFAATWTAIHPIDSSSPLYSALTARSLDPDDMMVVTFIGIDDSLSQTVHARWTYMPDDVVFGVRLCDVFGVDAKGRRTINLTNFHTTIPSPLTHSVPSITEETPHQ